MKWFRLFLVAAVLSLFVACESPTVPRFPPKEEEGNTDDPDPPPTQGMLSVDGEIFLV